MHRLVCLLFLGACASPSLPSRPLAPGATDGDSASPSDGALAFDLASGATYDLSVRTDLSAPPDLAAGDLSVPSGCLPRINELATGLGGTASDEFIEIYNPCATTLDLSGWKLVYRAGTNVGNAQAADSTTLYAFAGKHGTYVVIGGAGFTGTSDGALGGGLKDGTGAVGIRNGAGHLLDSVGYGTVDPSSAFVRGTAAVAPTTTSSIGRTPDGADTGDNNADFKLLSPPSPGAANP